jgi:RNA polymerase sigma-70 factor, ECF subfamily
MIIGTASLQPAEPAVLVAPAEPVADQNELRELYQKHWQTVFALAYRVTGNAADAEDAMQTVFVRLLSNRAMLDSARSPEGYLRRAAVNASIDILRSRRVRGEGELGDEPAADGVSVLDKERLRRALAKLEPEGAEMFVLCYLDGYTYEELAVMYHVERGTIASRLFRIRGELRDHLSK